MKIRLGLLALLAALLAPAAAQAQSVYICLGPSGIGACTTVSAVNPLPVTLSGGGGGGLSVTDQAAWSQGVSAFTPSGGEFNDTSTVSSGTQGTFRMTTKRALIIDTDTTGNALYSAITASIPAGANLIGKVGIDQTTPGTTNGVQVNAALPAGTNTIGTVGQLTYPVGATPITASATGTTGATTATLAGTSAKTTYICGYSIRANATAAATVTNTITGVITATLSSVMWVAPLASGLGIDEQIFSPCIPASGTNQAIAIVSGAPGSGGTVSSKGWGYQL